MDIQNKTWCVYSHSLPDGRRYIGQTCNISSRWKPSAYKNCAKFYKAIQEFGWNAFKHEILYDNLTLEEANQLETECIKKYDSIQHGFNLNYGGDNKLHSEETKKKMSETRKGVPHSFEHNQAISKALKGKPKSKEAIRNNQLAQHRKPVLCIETNIEYESLSEAERQTGILGETISRCCRGKQKTAGGYHWRFAYES